MFLTDFYNYRHGRHPRTQSQSDQTESDRVLERRRREPSEPLRLRENNFKPQFRDCARLSNESEVLEEQPKGRK